MWIGAAILSAFFAGITAILSKCGVKNTNSDVATAIRTTIVLVFSLIMVLIGGSYKGIGTIDSTSWVFLILSGLATGASWICYYKALSLGDVSKVSAVDKSSVILSVLFAIVIFPEERVNLVIKIICLILIAIGTFLMTNINFSNKQKNMKWLIFSLFSAFFASITSLLAKIGINNVDSNLATAIRTMIVLVIAWLIVFARKETKFIKNVTKKEFLFLVFSGLATGISWLCYYYAIKNGQVSVVVPIDKLSILVTILFSLIVFKEKFSLKSYLGVILITIGTLLMAIFK